MYKKFNDFLAEKIESRSYLPINESYDTNILTKFFQKLIPGCILTLKGNNLTIENTNAYEFKKEIIYFNYKITLVSTEVNVANFELGELTASQKIEAEENILKDHFKELCAVYATYNWDGKDLVFFDANDKIIQQYNRIDLDKKIQDFPII